MTSHILSTLHTGTVDAVNFNDDWLCPEELLYKSFYGKLGVRYIIETAPLYVPYVKYAEDLFGPDSWVILSSKAHFYEEAFPKNGQSLEYPNPLTVDDFNVKALSSAVVDRNNKGYNQFFEDNPEYKTKRVAASLIIAIPSHELVFRISSDELHVVHNGAEGIEKILHKMLQEAKIYAVENKYLCEPPAAAFNLVGLNSSNDFSSYRLKLPHNPLKKAVISTSYKILEDDNKTVDGMTYMKTLVRKLTKRTAKQDRQGIHPGKGLYIIHGAPGTGKSRFLMELLLQLSIADHYRPVFYFPPQMVKEIGSPQFTNFLLEYPGAIILAEDAENAIRAQEHRTDVITNLLNCTDGTIAEAQQLTFILTFNCEVEKIDAALLRPGRLKGKAYFNTLTIEEANDAATAIKKTKYKKLLSSPLDFTTSAVDGQISLAQIYHRIELQNEEKT